ncbi:MAG: hypothetical protein ABSA47_03590, partial [Verrucomicrobiota bacterium]
MSEDAQKPLTAPAPAAAPEPPDAWQPLTFGGVAAFARAPWPRLLLAQVVVAALAAAGVVWFLARCYAPVVTEAVQKLPDGASLTNGQLAGISGTRIAENKFLSIAITDDDHAELDQSADVQIALRKGRVEISSLLSSALGLVEFDYSTNSAWDLSQSHLEPLWGAWEPVVQAGAGIGVVIVLPLIWAALAVIYAPAAKFVAWFGDRQLSWGGAWRLACAAQMPGAMLLALGVVLYSRQTVDLIGLGYFETVHFLVGWTYVLAAPHFAPRLSPNRPDRNP